MNLSGNFTKLCFTNRSYQDGRCCSGAHPTLGFEKYNNAAHTKFEQLFRIKTGLRTHRQLSLCVQRYVSVCTVPRSRNAPAPHRGDSPIAQLSRQETRFARRPVSGAYTEFYVGVKIWSKMGC
jgi:hypothetical protein